MRVTNRMLYQAALQAMQRRLEKIQEDQTELSTLRRINRHADDPAGSAQVRSLRADLASVEQYRRNISNAKAWAQASESALGEVESVLHRAKEVAIEGGNAGRNDDDREIMAREVNQLLEQIFSLANLQFNSQYIFAGQNTNAAPFEAVRDSAGQITSVSMAGDLSGAILREVDNNTAVAINVSGATLFDPLTGPLQTLIALRDALQRNDVAGIQNTLSLIDNSVSGVLGQRAELGGLLARLERLEERLDLRQIDLLAAASEIEDADMAEVLSRLSADELAYQAALGAAGRLLQPSLIDFLG